MENNKYIGVLGGNEKDIKEMDMELCKKIYGNNWEKEFKKQYPSKKKELKAV